MFIKMQFLGCFTVGGPDLGKPCVFPFTFNGIVHFGCPKDPDDPSKRWCSTKVDQSGNHIGGQGVYGDCALSCPIHNDKWVEYFLNNSCLIDQNNNFFCQVSQIGNILVGKGEETIISEELNLYFNSNICISRVILTHHLIYRTQTTRPQLLVPFYWPKDDNSSSDHSSREPA